MFKDLKYGPEYKVDEKDRTIAEKLDFKEFIEHKISQPTKIVGIGSSSFNKCLIILLILFLISSTIEYLQFSTDLLAVFQNANYFSPLHQINFSQYRFVFLFYLLRFIFYAISVCFLIYILFAILINPFEKHLPELLKFDKILSSEENYLFSLVKNLKIEKTGDLNDFIRYDKDQSKYKLIGFYSSVDPLMTYNAFLYVPLSQRFASLILGTLVMATAFISRFTDNLIESANGIAINEDMLMMLLSAFNRILFLFFGLFLIIVAAYLFFPVWIRFLKFISELIDRQQDYVTSLIARFEKEKTEENYFPLQKALEELKELKKQINYPKRQAITIVALITALIPFLLTL